MKKSFIFLILFFITCLNVYAEDFVKNIFVDEVPLKDFSSDFEGPYTINVSSSKDSIKLGYDYDKDIYQGSGSISDVSLHYGDNDLSYTVVNQQNGNSKTYKIKVIRPDIRSSDNSLVSLTVGSNKVVLGDENEYNVTVDGKVSSVEIHATLPNGATFIDGYGERIGGNALKLNNETTSVEIKVKAENESIRNYKINITKINLKSNDASLKSLKVEGLDFDFKSEQLEYNLSVKNNISSVKIEAIKNHEKANVEYPESINLKNGVNTILVKVTAEDSSVKTYKLNITREEEVPIVSNIKIIGINFEFNPKIYNYKIETNLSKLDFNVTLSNKEATSEIKQNENLKNGSIVKIEAKDGDETVTYNFQIINKEEKQEKKVVTSKNSNNNFFKENEMILGLSIFGIGVLATLIAVLVKRKSKIM